VQTTSLRGIVDDHVGRQDRHRLRAGHPERTVLPQHRALDIDDTRRVDHGA
jgi:hypothetical protein